MGKAMERARDYVEKNFDYVGEKFPEEARKIHYGESPKNAASTAKRPAKKLKKLVEEGVGPLRRCPV